MIKLTRDKNGRSRWPSAWWSRFRRGARPLADGPDMRLYPPGTKGDNQSEKLFAPGMTLGAGESAQLHLATVFRDYPRILEAIKRGEMQVGVTNGPCIQTGRTSFETTATITLDGYPFGDIKISYTSEEPQ